jgi:hypothetical protein
MNGDLAICLKKVNSFFLFIAFNFFFFLEWPFTPFKQTETKLNGFFIFLEKERKKEGGKTITKREINQITLTKDK